MAIKSSTMLIVDILRLVESEDDDVSTVIKAAFDWEHARRLEVAKWLLATGGAAIIAVFALMAKEEELSKWILVGLPSIGGVLATAGYAALHRASVVHSRFMQTSILCARLKTVKPFLQRLRREGQL